MKFFHINFIQYFKKGVDFGVVELNLAVRKPIVRILSISKITSKSLAKSISKITSKVLAKLISKITSKVEQELKPTTK